MISAIADTHTVIWYLSGSPLLSEKAKNAIDRAADQGFYVGVSVITLVEIVYLIEKNRIAPDLLSRLVSILKNPDQVLIEVPLDSEIVQLMPKIPRSDVPDLPDRIIAVTALQIGVPVITKDSKIQSAKLKTIW